MKNIGKVEIGLLYKINLLTNIIFSRHACHLENFLVGKMMSNFKLLELNSVFNRPYPSSLVPLFQSESKCETILIKVTLICTPENETTCRTHFHMNAGFAFRLVLKQRHKRTQKWPKTTFFNSGTLFFIV